MGEGPGVRGAFPPQHSALSTQHSALPPLPHFSFSLLAFSLYCAMPRFVCVFGEEFGTLRVIAKLFQSN